MFKLKNLFVGKSINTETTNKGNTLQTASIKRKPHPQAIKEALNHPNGWVYEIDAAFEKDANVPSQAITGAWKVNAKGIIEGDFIPNPNYLDLKPGI
ncbi:hypothetical protein [Mucilaginibacter angelicae]